MSDRIQGARSASTEILARVYTAVRDLADPPSAPGWNADELADLFEPGQILRNAAVLLPIVERDDGPTMLFTLRTDVLRNHAGQVSFPGGQADPEDADAIATAVREMQEETGIAPEFVEPFGFLDSFNTVSGFCVTPVVATIHGGFQIVPDPHEVAEVFEVPLDYILTPNRMRIRAIQWRGRARQIAEFDYQRRRIWGATAAILQNLINRMEKDQGGA